MKICSLYRIFYAALFAVVATLSQLAWAQDAHRDKLEAFFSAVELPKTRELFSLLIAEIRQRVPQDFVAAYGQGAKLGADWKPGNLYFDRAAKIVADLVEEQYAQGQFLNISARDAASEVNLTWSGDDIDFLIETAKTPFGQQTMEWVDLYILPMIKRAWSRLPNMSADFIKRADEIVRESNERFKTITPEYLRLAKENKAVMDRYNRLFAEINQETGKVIGERIGAKKMTDFLTSSRELLLDLHDISDEYRKMTGDPANKI